MKKNTKGFTLIELLAVIVILAIIALIATPIVLNLINTARKGAAARSAEGIRASLKTQYFANQVENPNAPIEPVKVDFTNAKEDTPITEYGVTLGQIIDGKLPKAGEVTISTDGKVSTTAGKKLLIDGYYCSFADTQSATCTTES